MRTQREKAEKVIRHIESYWDKPMRLKNLSAAFQMDSSDIERAFRTKNKTTIKRYIDLRRKEKLGALIEEDNLCGYEIAEALGFATESTFYRWVKRHYGRTLTSLRSRVDGDIM